MKKLITLAIVSVAILVALVFGYQYYLFSPQPQPQRTVEIDMVTKQWFYDPKVVATTDASAQATMRPTTERFANTTIVVTKGDLVIIQLQTGDVPHGFAINGYPDVGPYEVTPGQTVTIRFTANQEGTFVFYCTVFCGPGHPNHRGNLIVLP